MAKIPASRYMCLIIMAFILFAGLITLILWLTFRPHHPKYTVHEFALHGLGHTNGPTFFLAARNPNRKTGFYYEYLNGTVYYDGQYIGTTPLIISPLYQEPKNTLQLSGVVSGGVVPTDDPRKVKSLDDSAIGRKDFLLKLTGVVQYKLSMFDKRHHRVTAKCEISVGPDGLMKPFYKSGKCDVSI